MVTDGTPQASVRILLSFNPMIIEDFVSNNLLIFGTIEYIVYST